MKKIRTLIAHDNKQTCQEIKNVVSKLDYVDVLEITNNGIDTYNKIISLKPEMVFTQYNFENMEGKELLRKIKEQLKEHTPMFNIITSPISQEKINETYGIIGNKFNVLITDIEEDKIINIIEDYKKYVNK